MCNLSSVADEAPNGTYAAVADLSSLPDDMRYAVGGMTSAHLEVMAACALLHVKTVVLLQTKHSHGVCERGLGPCALMPAHSQKLLTWATDRLLQGNVTRLALDLSSGSIAAHFQGWLPFGGAFGSSGYPSPPPWYSSNSSGNGSSNSSHSWYGGQEVRPVRMMLQQAGGEDGGSGWSADNSSFYNGSYYNGSSVHGSNYSHHHGNNWTYSGGMYGQRVVQVSGTFTQALPDGSIMKGTW